MSTVIRFEQVSKRYRLGVSRTSLLKSFSNILRKVYKHGRKEATGQEYLWALSDVSFELSSAESMALIGRNGAGKSTILKLLANITHPTSGQIIVDGRVSALIELGSGFHPDLTGRDNIYLNGTILGLSRAQIQHRFDEIVAFSELERFIETPVKRYSTGMLVRLGFAVAACMEPEILLVDEVLAVGDASFRLKCLQRIQTLLKEGTSILFVSHNLYMAQAVCPKALYIEQGRIKYKGKTSDVIDLYERDLHEERARKLMDPQSRQIEKIVDVEITDVEVLDENGTSPTEFSSGQTVEIRVHYNAYRSEENANMVVKIIRTDGLICSMMRTALDQAHLFLVEGKGIYSIFLEPLQLTGGSYFFDVEITNETDSISLATRASRWFYVTGLALSHEGENGVFEPMRRWGEHQDSIGTFGDKDQDNQTEVISESDITSLSSGEQERTGLLEL